MSLSVKSILILSLILTSSCSLVQTCNVEEPVIRRLVLDKQIVNVIYDSGLKGEFSIGAGWVMLDEENQKKQSKYRDKLESCLK